MLKKILSSVFIGLIAIPAYADTPITTHTKVIDQTPTIETSAYAAGDLVAPLLTFTNAGREGQGAGGLVQQVTVTDLGAEAKDLELVVFDTNPSNTTFTVNSAADIHDTDLLTVVCRITISSHSSFNDNGASSADNVGCPFKAEDLYGMLIAREAVTYDTTAALTIRLQVVQD